MASKRDYYEQKLLYYREKTERYKRKKEEEAHGKNDDGNQQPMPQPTTQLQQTWSTSQTPEPTQPQSAHSQPAQQQISQHQPILFQSIKSQPTGIQTSQPNQQESQPQPPLSQASEPQSTLPKQQPLFPQASQQQPTFPHTSQPQPPLPHSSQPQPPLPLSSQQQPPLPQASQQQPPLPQSSQQQSPLPQSIQQQPSLPNASQQQPPFPQSSQKQPSLPQANQSQMAQPQPPAAQRSELLNCIIVEDEFSSDFVADIDNSLVQKYLPILQSGLQPDEKFNIIKRNSFPRNCKQLKLSPLNPEVVKNSLISDHAKKSDERQVKMLNQLGLGIAAITKSMTLLLSEGELDIRQIFKTLTDSCGILSDLHFTENQNRISNAISKVKLSSSVDDSIKYEIVFGNGLQGEAKAVVDQILENRKEKKSKAPANDKQGPSEPPQTPENRPSMSRGGEKEEYNGNHRSPYGSEASRSGSREHHRGNHELNRTMKKIKRLHVHYTNIRGLLKNREAVHHHLATQRPHLLFLTETQVESDRASLACPGYKLENNFQRKSGVCVYVHEDLDFSRLAELETSEIPVLWILVRTGYQHILYACVYKPHGDASETTNLFQTLSARARAEIKRQSWIKLVFLGDFNAHHKEWLFPNQRTNQAGREAYKFAESFGLTQMVKEATRRPEGPSETASCLDLLLTTDPERYAVSVGEPVGSSDHCLVQSVFDCLPPHEGRRGYGPTWSHQMDPRRRHHQPICFYHEKFGRMSHKCVPPCTWVSY